MKKVVSIIALGFLFLSCKENDKIDANEYLKNEFLKKEVLVNKSAEEEILQLQKEGINLFQETKKIYDKSKEDYVIITFASESEEKLKEYFKNNELSINLSNEKPEKSQNLDKVKRIENKSEIKISMYLFMGEIFSKNNYKTVTVNVMRNKNARVKGVQAYSSDQFTSNGGFTTATVTWMQNSNNNNGVDVEFQNKYGWLGSWYYDSSMSLYSGYQTHTNVKEEAWKRRLIVWSTYNNYTYEFSY